jgi:NADH:ubiquinone oxidoreductase subunit
VLDRPASRTYSPAAVRETASGRESFSVIRVPLVLSKIFTWWNGATLGALLTIKRRAVFVGEDSYGNRYFEAKDTKDSYDGRKRRWVTYRGYAEASKIPPEWHGWMHYTWDEPPTVEPVLRRSWELDHLPNLTGTPLAYRPKGAISRGGERQRASGDYQAWRPE